MQNQEVTEATCGACGDAVNELHDARLLKGVTSDCKPWPRNAAIGLCSRCGHIQKVPSDQWRQDVEEIYRGYEIYHLSGGGEQVLFGGDGPKPRSQVLLEKVRATISLPREGRMLDIGCGNGAALRSFGWLYPEWTLIGADHNPTFRDTVEGISQVERFHSGRLDELHGPFGFITLLETLEHVPGPCAFLVSLRRLLAPNAMVLMQVPDLAQNPFDLAVVDHCSHFTSDTLASLAALAGFNMVLLERTWVPKELTLVAKVSEAPNLNCAFDRPLGAPAEQGLLWLRSVADHAASVAGQMQLGVFGTAVAGTWLANELGDKANFFVDEDIMRAGRAHMGRRVMLPADAPKGSAVYIAFPPALAEQIQRRLQKEFPQVNFVTPPPFAATRDVRE